MHNIFQTITGTPIWVWFILAYLIFIGVRLTKTQIIWLPKFFIIPSILIASRYKIFLSSNILIYLSAMSIGLVIGFLVMSKIKMRVIKESISIELQGSYLTITILLIFFVMRYIIAYLNTSSPATSIHYFPFEIGINGLFAGYFIGRAICALYRYNKS